MNTGLFRKSVSTDSTIGPLPKCTLSGGKAENKTQNKLFILAGVVALAGVAVLLTLHYGEQLENNWSSLKHSPFVLGLQLLVMVNIAVFIWRVLLVLNHKKVAVCADHELLSCTVVIPAYNEGRQVLNSLRSVAKSNFPKNKLQIVCVDDGSRDDTWRWMQKGRRELGPIVQLVRQPVNKGKRHALYEGFKRATGQVWITIDSDSEVEPMALRQMVSSFCRNQRVGAVAGNVRVLNKAEGAIPRMLDVVFTFSFDFNRQAQGQVNTVMCTPGALSGYRREAAEPVLDQWLRQRFMGREANIGEDRAMTNLILSQGWLTHFQGEAVVFTNVPTRYTNLCKMYLRWARSNIRESIAMTRFIFGKVRPEPMSGARINLAMELTRLVMAEVFKVMIIWGIAAVPLLFGYNLIIGALISGLIPATVHRLRHGGWDFLWAFPYVCFSLFALSWISLYALLTPHRNSWLTRTLTAPQQNPVLQLLPRPLEQLAGTNMMRPGKQRALRQLHSTR